MKSLFSRAAGLALVLPLGCVSLGIARQEYLSSLVPPGEFAGCEQHGELLVCHLPNETVDVWTRVLVLRRAARSEAPSAEGYAESVAGMIRERCSAVSLDIVDSGRQPSGQVESSVLFEVEMSGCPPESGPEAEVHLIRALFTRSNFFRITYRARASELPPEERSKWIRHLSGITVTLTPPWKSSSLRLRYPHVPRAG